MTDKIKRHDSSINIWLEEPQDPVLDQIFDRVLTTLRQRGFTVNQDSDVAECIRQDYYVAKKGQLECYIDRSGRHIEVEFFQNVVTVNSNGGRYDFHKKEKMPFLIRQEFVLERSKIEDMLHQTYGLTVKQEKPTEGIEYILHRRAELMRFHGENFYTRPTPMYNAHSAVREILLKDGDQVYFLMSGRYFSGTAYHNINNMWWVLMPCGDITNIANFDLHTQIPETLRGRHFSQTHRQRRRAEALNDAVKKANTAKAETLRRLLTPDEPYYVISPKHTAKQDKTITMWGQSGGGYTFAFSHAGKYSKAEIMANLGYYNSGGAIAVDAETVERLASFGEDDNHHRTAHLKNTPEVWSILLYNMIAPTTYPVIPAIMEKEKKTRRARA